MRQLRHPIQRDRHQGPAQLRHTADEALLEKIEELLRPTPPDEPTTTDEEA